MMTGNHPDTENKLSKNLKTRLSVPIRLNILNSIVLISGLLSVFGAYEIQLGGTLHKLNFLHAKNTYILTKQINEFEKGIGSTIQLKETIEEIRQQPVDCLAITKSIDRFVMKILGTDKALDLCLDDIEKADQTLISINDYEKGIIDHSTLIRILDNSAHGFFKRGQSFEPLVGKTVTFVFLSVFIFTFAKAILVPFFGVYLSSGVARDYKELEQIKNELEKEKKRNEKIQEEKMLTMSTMVAGIAHEINTPVGISVTASSHMEDNIKRLKKCYEKGAISHQDMESFFSIGLEASQILNTNLQRSSDLISSFKMVVVDQSNNDIRTINLKAYLDDIILSLSPQLRKSEHKIKLDCPEDISISTFAGALSQIVTNLVTNSLAHAFKNKPSGIITITAKYIEPDSIHIVYKDDGTGISASILDRIFDPFFTTKRGSGGTGLGLHISHNLVTQKLGGSIHCKSKEREGTQFDIIWQASKSNSPKANNANDFLSNVTQLTPIAENKATLISQS